MHGELSYSPGGVTYNQCSHEQQCRTKPHFHLPNTTKSALIKYTHNKVHKTHEHNNLNMQVVFLVYHLYSIEL